MICIFIAGDNVLNTLTEVSLPVTIIKGNADQLISKVVSYITLQANWAFITLTSIKYQTVFPSEAFIDQPEVSWSHQNLTPKENMTTFMGKFGNFN